MLIDKNKLKVNVHWADPENTSDKNDERDQKAFAKMIKRYIKMFDELPPVGLWFDGGTCSSVGKVTEILFSGDEIWVEIDF